MRWPLSRQFSDRGNHLVLECLPGFLPKHHSPSFMSSPPVLHSFQGSSVAVPHCPVRAFRLYFSASERWFVDSSPSVSRPLWRLPKSGRPLSQQVLTKHFKSLIVDCLYLNDLEGSQNQVTPHQMRKFAASYSHQLGQDEEKVRQVMGFSSLKVLKKNYQAHVPPLEFPCILPGGAFSPS